MAIKQKVLVIDDDKINLKIMSDILNDDVKVMVAKSGEQGIRKAIDYQPDLILLDVLMPDMDGFETMNHLCRHSKTSTITVIFITALNDTSNEEKALLMGACDYIQKPLHTSIVKARVRLHLQLIKQRKMLEELAHIDSLTSIANRRKYQETMANTWQESINTKNCISLLVADIDNFKQYNDCYGHATGDKVLKQVADILSEQVGNKGLVARYGGEEFVILLSHIPTEEAQIIAKNCQQEIESLHLRYQDKTFHGNVTISIGGASKYPTSKCSPDTFFNQVDNCLMEAKNSGKNKVLWVENDVINTA
ncbi:diguanylate cyclase [Marinomonas sp.]|nr:diguanylate cyclase [Marinomonas sp.]MDB4837263.1 diguanylate cyclase [Marinomonas sp.]